MKLRRGATPDGFLLRKRYIQASYGFLKAVSIDSRFAPAGAARSAVLSPS
ncbi:hypothetical protein BN1263170262 [Stenotrophomonas maltophilia]|nr:hypothetical protein BN1263170262 [Stenotrophomonas maltophilia]